ncbi:MAG TPA: endolytic transglycosylase MltG [Candidatus Cloacimonadota bacterium]|nr:endolytic transglycosylase MltG [Candidatus Cloacimonadota bacterium]HPS39821.1 endolytic transglycosylase MltG [Candidatus Cloacimonadota bacterium]
MKRTQIIAGAILLILALGITAVALTIIIPKTSDEVLIRVDRGDNAATIAGKLHRAGVIRSELIFRALAKLSGADKELKTGLYTFGGKVNLMDTVRRLRGGKSERLTVTIPEGWSLYRTLHRIARSGLIGYDSLYAQATEPGFVKEITGLELPSLEGYLYPETYRFEPGMSAREVLKLQTDEFFRRLDSAGINAKADSTFYRKLVLASIIESESMYEDERGTVAGVYMNRLEQGMRLEACPTVDYILEKQGIHREVLTLDDVNIASPYNTYRNGGLPPGPICNPSLSSIQAAYNPVKHDYLFFQADRKGRNVFSRTYAEHLKKMAGLPKRVESK